jgi:uncharacterized protein YdaU (DUF1376 family)
VNYWERHIGDYARDAGHLSMMEHGAYTILLDRFYSTELPIPADKVHRLCRANTEQERAAVDAVLEEFWTLTEEGWVNGRALEEIQIARKRIVAAQQNGRKGGRPRTQAKPSGEQTQPEDDPSTTQSGSLDGTQEKPSGFPMGKGSAPGPQPNSNPTQSSPPPTSHLSSEANASGGQAPSALTPKDMVFAIGVPLLTAAAVKESNARSFLAMQCKSHGESRVVEALQACAKEGPVQPVPWLTAHLGAKRAGGRSGRHHGFDTLKYRGGADDDDFPS